MLSPWPHLQLNPRDLVRMCTFTEENEDEDITPKCPVSVPRTEQQMKCKEQGKAVDLPRPSTFFLLQLLKQFIVPLSLLGHFPHQINESVNKRLTKMFTFGNKLSAKALAQETSHNLPLFFSEIIWEKQGGRAGIDI